jgi:hypothetical protein
MPRPSSLVPSIITSDTALHTGTAKVYWIMYKAGATGGAFQLADSVADGGTDLIDITVTADTAHPVMMTFDPPLEFKAGIFVDVPGTNVTVTIAWS